MRFLSNALRFSHGNNREKEKKTVGNRLKRSRNVKAANWPISSPSAVLSPWSGVQSAGGPVYGYFSPEDFGRASLRVTNPDHNGTSPNSACFTPQLTIDAPVAETAQQSENQAIVDLQSLPGFFGPQAETSDTPVGRSFGCPQSVSMGHPGNLDEQPLNPLRANPPSPLQSKESESWLSMDASTESILPDTQIASLLETGQTAKAKRRKSFNPLTEEDSPRNAHPTMHGPGSRFYLYSQPDTFRKSSERQLPRSNPAPDPEVIHAHIRVVSKHRQPPSNGDLGQEEQGSPFGHYADHFELPTSGSPTTSLALLSEPTKIRRHGNMNGLKQRAKRILESMTPVAPSSPRAKQPPRRYRSIEDFQSFQRRRRRSSASAVNRWDDYAIVESVPALGPPSRRSLPSFSRIRLTLSRTFQTAAGVQEVLRGNGYFTARHLKRQRFLRRSFRKAYKKNFRIEAATQYLDEALGDLGSFELDFSGFRVDNQ